MLRPCSGDELVSSHDNDHTFRVDSECGVLVGSSAKLSAGSPQIEFFLLENTYQNPCIA